MLVQSQGDKQDMAGHSCKDVRSWYSSFFVPCLQGHLEHGAVPTLS